MASTATAPLKSVLVIGGCGFLGHHVVKQLLADSDKPVVSVLDLKVDRNTFLDVKYYPGDITSPEKVTQVLALVQPQVIIHTASPVAAGLAAKSNALFEKVNVGGTQNLLECAAKASSVHAFVYTSSSSVSHAGPTHDVRGIDETSPLVMGSAQPEFYSHTKAVAEKAVLEANRVERSDFLTCALRPAGIFGEGDVQALPGLLTAYYNGKVRFQIGDNKNRFDWTYVGNVAYAHILAAKALVLTESMATAPLDHERVDGETFFITNDDPWPFWDFARAVWRRAGDRTPVSEVRVFSRTFMLVIAWLAQWFYWIFTFGTKEPNIRLQTVRFSTMERWYNIDKAKRRLAYRPLVDVQTGIDRGVDWAIEQRKRQADERTKKSQ